MVDPGHHEKHPAHDRQGRQGPAPEAALAGSPGLPFAGRNPRFSGGFAVRVIESQVVETLADDPGVDFPDFLCVSQEQGVVGEDVDHPRVPAGELVNGLYGVSGKDLVPFFLPGHPQPVFDVFSGIFQVQRMDVIPAADALEQGPAPGLAQFLVQLGLADQEDVDQFFIRQFHVGEEPDLLQQFKRQLVGLVDDQDDIPVPSQVFLQVRFELKEKSGF